MGLWELFEIYFREEPDFESYGQIMIGLGLILVSISQYAVELYRLVKKKTTIETMAVMQLPLGCAVAAAFFVTQYVSVPTRFSFLSAVSRSGRKLGLGMTVLSLACVFLMLAGRFLWNEGRLSRALGTAEALGVGVPGLCLLASGQDFFRLLPKAVLTGFLYLVLLLAARVAILLLGTLICICNARIRISWKPSMHPGLFFRFYQLFCQNAMLRGTLLYWGALAVRYGVLWKRGTESSDYRDLSYATMLTAIIGAAAFVLAVRPAHLAVRRLKRQGDFKAKAELFCREYFLEGPYLTGKSYSATRHFLIDEEAPAVLYEWSELIACSEGWVSGKNGWVGVLRFGDGRVFEVPKDNPQAEELMHLARQRIAGMKTREQTEHPSFGRHVPKPVNGYAFVIGLSLLILTAVLPLCCL